MAKGGERRPGAQAPSPQPPQLFRMPGGKLRRVPGLPEPPGAWPPPGAGSPAQAGARPYHRRPREPPTGRDYISSGARAGISLGLGKVVPRLNANSAVPGWSGRDGGRGQGRGGAGARRSPRPRPARACALPPARGPRRPEGRTKVAPRGANSRARLGAPAGPSSSCPPQPSPRVTGRPIALLGEPSPRPALRVLRSVFHVSAPSPTAFAAPSSPSYFHLPAPRLPPRTRASSDSERKLVLRRTPRLLMAAVWSDSRNRGLFTLLW